MARVPVESSVRAEALQNIAMPKAQAVQARFDPRSDTAYRLAESLGAAQPYIDQMKQGAAINDRNDAMTYVAGMTAEDLRKKIDAGELPAWKSPLWVATVQNTSGDNLARSVFREADSKITNGEFKTQEELEQFIQQRRDDVLAGKSKYEITGFDRNFNELKLRSQSAMNTVMTKRYETEGVTVATEEINNRLSDVTSTEWTGKTNQEKVSHVMQSYDKSRTLRLINDDTARSVLDTTLMRLAASGNKDLVEEFLKTRMPNNGPTVETFLDVRNGNSTGRTIAIRNTAENQFNQVQRENKVRYVEAERSTIINEAQQQADELVAIGNGAAMTDRAMPTVNGGSETLKGKDLIEAAVYKQIAANPDMQMADQVRLFKLNGVENKQWKKELETAVMNFGEVSIDAQGKPIGKLMEPTVQALDRFAVINQVDKQFAKELVGESTYKLLYKVDALRSYLNDPNQAAAIVNQINRKEYNPQTWANTQKQINSAMGNLTDASFFSWDWGNANKNILPIQDNLKELSEALVQARIAPDGKTAVKMASEYMEKSTVRVNDTMYMKHDLPRVIDGKGFVREREDAGEWFKNYQKESLIPRLQKELKIDPSLSDLTLMPMPGGQPTYMVQLKAQPLFQYVTRAEVEKWIGEQLDIRDQIGADQYQAARDKRNNPALPKSFETDGGAALMTPRGIRRRSE